MQPANVDCMSLCPCSVKTSQRCKTLAKRAVMGAFSNYMCDSVQCIGFTTIQHSFNLTCSW